MVNEFKKSERFNSFIQSLGRIQSQIQALMELEKSWSDDLSIEQLQELLNRKQQLINNIQTLINNQKILEKELMRSQEGALTSQYQSFRDKQIVDIHQMLEIVISLHSRHEQQLKDKSDKIKNSVDDVQQALTLIKTYQVETDKQGLQIDLAG